MSGEHRLQNAVLASDGGVDDRQKNFIIGMSAVAIIEIE